ncbi:MAG: glycoside hydrolase family 57 protein [Pyramidobacter sp.]|nr:glycoside hydrolase family 57 protein [Pyramidobacter sp.]MBO6266891.1 glycoside hydrolase family 57 protein [Synergistaceae bacterium]MBP3752854.1 glycoside hydrolase family 57 protein [Pyramidobacter sp.]MBP3849153.1 glycoside hydrolase family 57 protein [Pyramidobacter sp.]MBQ8091850.1 glycoside hydrolase family 57 protein [Pyramidobacter sp.]
MPSICFYFQVHQPYRLRHYSFFDIGQDHFYEDVEANRTILDKVARKCYLPMNALLLKMIKRWEGRFKVSFSISGVAMDQFAEYQPEIIDSFRALADTGCAELISETYAHSLAALFDPDEFRAQVKMHDDLLMKHFGVTPHVFRNTELIYRNDIAQMVEDMGYDAILTEGADHILGWRSPNFMYSPQSCNRLKLMLKNYRLSDDIAFRFSNRGWEEWPLTTEKFANWAHAVNGNGELINLFMDYETFGEHQWAETGIFDFMEALPAAIFTSPDMDFVTPSEAAKRYSPVAKVDVPNAISWADVERDLTAWLGNDMERDAIEACYALKDKVMATGDEGVIRTWRRLQTSDHFYYMCTKWFSDGDVHKYFNPYGTPYDAYINYMNVLSDFGMSLS